MKSDIDCTLAAQWLYHRVVHIPIDIEEEKLREHQLAFYAGAGSAVTLALTIESSDDTVETKRKEQVSKLLDLIKETNHFYSKIIEESSTNLKKRDINDRKK